MTGRGSRAGQGDSAKYRCQSCLMSFTVGLARFTPETCQVSEKARRSRGLGVLSSAGSGKAGSIARESARPPSLHMLFMSGIVDSLELGRLIAPRVLRPTGSLLKVEISNR